MVKMVLDRWNALIKRADSIFDSLTEEQLYKEITPGKNRGIYLLGHFIGVHDDLFTLLNMGERLYPSYEDIFVNSPDKSGNEFPSVEELRANWKRQSEILSHKFEILSSQQWFEKHNSISDEDFVKEPHRNKLNVLLTRVSHLSYHVGQLVLIK